MTQDPAEPFIRGFICNRDKIWALVLFTHTCSGASSTFLQFNFYSFPQRRASVPSPAHLRETVHRTEA